LLDSSHELPWLKRIRAIALARLGQLDAARDDLVSWLAIARERGALYDLVATLEVLDKVGAESDQGTCERDSILAKLGIERLPRLEFSPCSLA
jgi:hypothetical protein